MEPVFRGQVRSPAEVLVAANEETVVSAENMWAAVPMAAVVKTEAALG